MNASGGLLLQQRETRIFLRAVGIEPNPLTQLDLFLEACKQVHPRFSGEKDLVRFMLEKDETLWPEEVVDAILNFAGSLGMLRGVTTLTGVYDLIIAFGGARRAPLNRASCAAQAIIDFRASAKAIIIAGSTRQLGDFEKALVQDYAPGAETEFDLCKGASQKILKKYPELNIVTVCSDNPKSGSKEVIDAVMRYYDENMRVGDEQLRVAGVTTQIYVRGLDLDMACAASRYGWKCHTTAGHASEPETVLNRTISTYLAECITTAEKAAIAASKGL